MLRPMASSSARSAGVRLAGLPRVRRMSSETRLRSAGSSRPQWSWPARRTSKTISQGARRRRSMLGPYPAHAVRHAPVGDETFRRPRRPCRHEAHCAHRSPGRLRRARRLRRLRQPEEQRRVDRPGQRQEGEGRQRHRRWARPHALPLHRRGAGRPGVHRRLRQHLAAGRGRRRGRAPEARRDGQRPTTAGSSSPTTGTRSTATPATGPRPTPTARASAASGSRSSLARANNPEVIMAGWRPMPSSAKRAARLD